MVIEKNGDERRSEERHKITPDIPLISVRYKKLDENNYPNSKAETGGLINISRSGIGIRINENIAAGQKIELALELPDQSGSSAGVIHVTGEARWIQSLGDNFYRLGIMFDIESRNKYIDKIEEFIALLRK